MIEINMAIDAETGCWSWFGDLSDIETARLELGMAGFLRYGDEPRDCHDEYCVNPNHSRVGVRS